MVMPPKLGIAIGTMMSAPRPVEPAPDAPDAPSALREAYAGPPATWPAPTVDDGVAFVCVRTRRSGRRHQPLADALRGPVPDVRLDVGGGTSLPDDPLLHLTLPDLAIDFYVFSSDRFVRAFTFTLDVDATHLAEYKEITNNPDGTQSVNDLTGQAPDETFFRAFPEWRAVTSLGWNMNRFTGSLRFRWFDEMENEGTKLDSAMFTDLRLSWNPSFADDSMTFTIGFNNVLDEGPPV